MAGAPSLHITVGIETDTDSGHGLHCSGVSPIRSSALGKGRSAALWHHEALREALPLAVPPLGELRVCDARRRALACACSEAARHADLQVDAAELRRARRALLRVSRGAQTAAGVALAISGVRMRHQAADSRATEAAREAGRSPRTDTSPQGKAGQESTAAVVDKVAGSLSPPAVHCSGLLGSLLASHQHLDHDLPIGMQ